MNSHDAEPLETQIKDLLSKQHPTSHEEEFKFLTLRTDEYLDRWIGFAEIANIDIKATMRNKVFLVLLAAINVMEDILDSIDDPDYLPKTDFKFFQNSIQYMIAKPDAEEIDVVRNAFFALKQSVLSATE